MRKYALLPESITYNGYTLHRIQAVRAFGDVSKGQVGGYVECESNLSHDRNCWVGGVAMVYGRATVYGDALVTEKAQVFGGASVFDHATISGVAVVYNRAKVYGNADVADRSTVSTSRSVCDHVKLYGNAVVADTVSVYDRVHVLGNAQLYDHVVARDCATIEDNAYIFGDAIIEGSSVIKGNAKVYGKAIIQGNAYICRNAKIGFGVINYYLESAVTSETDVNYIASVINCYPTPDGFYYLYKLVDKIGDGIYRSICDPNLTFRDNEYSTVNRQDDSEDGSFESEIVVGTPQSLMLCGDTLIMVKVHKDDIVACSGRRLIVNKVLTLGTVRQLNGKSIFNERRSLL